MCGTLPHSSIVARAVDSLRKHGCALVKLSKRQARAIWRVHRCASRFFALPASRKESARELCILPAIGPAPVIIGHWKPSDSKELLRIFDSCPRSLPLALRRCIAEARGILDEVLVCCLVACLKSAGCPISRRSLRYLCRGACPLDCFYYHNRPGSVRVPCTPHCDRGLLHAIVASPVPGLELFDRQRGEWHSVQELWPSLEPLSHVIILANDALAELSHTQPGWCGGQIEACVHRVVRADSVPRLSISYELRPSAVAVDPFRPSPSGRSRWPHRAQ